MEGMEVERVRSVGIRPLKGDMPLMGMAGSLHDAHAGDIEFKNDFEVRPTPEGIIEIVRVRGFPLDATYAEVLAAAGLEARELSESQVVHVVENFGSIANGCPETTVIFGTRGGLFAGELFLSEDPDTEEETALNFWRFDIGQPAASDELHLVVLQEKRTE